MTIRLTPAELAAHAGRQLSLFKSKRQRGTRPPPAPEYNVHCMIADDLVKFGAPGWIFTHIPSGELRSWTTAVRLKRMGVMPGWPDFVLMNRDGVHHYLEIKREKLGRVSDAQERFRDHCFAADRDHVRYAMAYGYAEAREALVGWGALRGLAP